MARQPEFKLDIVTHNAWIRLQVLAVHALCAVSRLFPRSRVLARIEIGVTTKITGVMVLGKLHVFPRLCFEISRSARD